MTETTEQVLGRPVTVRVERLGGDLHVLVHGGDAPHMGGMALAIPYLSAGTRPSAYLSSLSVPGHKDEELWRRMAKRLAVEFDTKVVVAGGVEACCLLLQAECVAVVASDKDGGEIWYTPCGIEDACCECEGDSPWEALYELA